MADKPSRALVLYGYGLAPFIKQSHSHIHALASIGCCGFLALEDYSSPTPEGEATKLIRELAQLLDANEAFEKAVPSSKKDADLEAVKQFPSMMERFMGMKAALVTNSSVAKHLVEKIGLTPVDFNELLKGQSSDFAAEKLLELLGFQDGKALEEYMFDLVFLHIGEQPNGEVENDLEYVNSFVGKIMQLAQPGSEVGSRLHFSVIMSYGTDFEDDPNLSLKPSNEGNNDFELLFPRQSYTLKGVDLRNHIRHHCPMLVAQWQDAVTRKDLAQEFSFSEFKKKSGYLAIAADRFLYEVAFKLWKAPKYGA